MLGSSVAFAILAYSTTLLLWIPAPSHLRAKNAGILIIAGWTTLGNIIEASSAISLLDAPYVINVPWCDFGMYQHHLIIFSCRVQISMGDRCMHRESCFAKEIGSDCIALFCPAIKSEREAIPVYR